MKFSDTIFKGDTVHINSRSKNKHRNCKGIIHLPPNNVYDTAVYIKSNNKQGPRRIFETFKYSTFQHTRMVLTEKNIYKCPAGGKSMDDVWLETALEINDLDRD